MSNWMIFKSFTRPLTHQREGLPFMQTNPLLAFTDIIISFKDFLQYLEKCLSVVAQENKELYVVILILIY